MNRIFTAMLISFIVGLVISPIVIFFAKKLKAGQNIYEYVEMHKGKQGTPTMGGIGIVIAIFIGSVCAFSSHNKMAYIALIIMLCFGILGFLDDFLKITFKHNEGLKPYQKIIGQTLIAIIVTIFAYQNNFVGPTVFIPFTTISFSLGWWYIPFCLFVFLATVNAVNLTDGLDGLAGSVSMAYLMGFTFVCFLLISYFGPTMQVEKYFENLNLLIVGGAGVGALMAYLIFNCFPAKIFMGDTGSLALGGLISCLAIFSQQPFLILIIGLCFVVSALSVVLQVGYYKLKHKRIFLMAPLHHHFEKKGLHENRIVFIYTGLTALLSIIGIILTLVSIK